MDKTERINNRYQSVARGLLAILWGATILFDFIPLGVGLIGSGLILIGVNLLRTIKALPIKNDNAVIGALALAWGGLELARPFLRGQFPSADLDWVIFALLLVGFGVTMLTRELLRFRRTEFGA
jgi:hypothetical protein